MLDLSIIIVSWNVWDLLRGCLAAIERLSRTADSAGDATIRRFGPAAASATLEVPATLEVIVVDNASSDATVDAVRTLFPWVRLIAGTENVGFTRGNNIGYSASRGENIFFLNPDTEIIDEGPQSPIPNPTDSLWLLYTALRDDPHVGLVAPRLRYGDGAQQSSRRRFPTPLTGFWESTWLGQVWPNNPWSRRLHWPIGRPPCARMWIGWWARPCWHGAQALEEIRTAGDEGPFDEGFFMYSEEVDLCRRLKQLGWGVRYVPEAQVVHYEGQSSAQVTAARHIHFNTSKVRYYHKWFGPEWAALLRWYLLLEFRIQLGLEWVKWRLGHKPELRVARIAAYRQVIASGLRAEL